MKLFHSFDTSFRKDKIKEYQNKYGVDNVLSFGRSRLYWIIKVVLPFVFLLMMSFFVVILFGESISKGYIEYVVIVVIIIDIFLIFPILLNYIDYKMDFIIITSESITMYKQMWLFKKNLLTINANAIKSISVERKNLLYSMFNNWDLIFLSEAITTNNDEKDYWKMTLRWVAKPEKKSNKITNIINLT